MSDSIQWGELPVSVREAIEEHTGPVTDSVLGGAGFRTGMRLILHTETGDVFVKGIGPDGGDIERGDLDLGAELALFVPASPSCPSRDRLTAGCSPAGGLLRAGKPA
jgi:hypothetical protein